jgi:hypothetical protein
MLRRANYLSLDANRDVAKVGGDSARCAMLARTAEVTSHDPEPR